jgi:hypothetical protein
MVPRDVLRKEERKRKEEKEGERRRKKEREGEKKKRKLPYLEPLQRGLLGTD